MLAHTWGIIKKMSSDTFPNEQQKVKSMSCGPNCLLNVYKKLGIDTDLEKILKQLEVTESDATHVPQLARHVNNLGLENIILSSCTHTVSADWKDKSGKEIIELLKKWTSHNHKNSWLRDALFLQYYLQEGGELKILDLTTKIFDEYLNDGYYLINCVEESWLWGKRKIKGEQNYDSTKGLVTGHFVVVYGKEDDKYLISDPYPTNIKNRDGLYKVSKDKLLVSTLIWDPQVLAIKK